MKSIVIIINLLVVNYVFAQQVKRCAFDEMIQVKSQSNPNYKLSIDDAFQYAKTQSQLRSNNAEDVLRIPVVVHVVYKTAAQNLPDSLIFNQIEILNRDFNRQSADTANERSVFAGIPQKANIEFYLACTDPDGQPTNGITRTQTNKDAFTLDLFGGGLGIDEVKFDSTGGKSAWDVNRYLNIWVCNTVDAGSFFGAVLGLAYPPQGAPNWPVDAFPADERIQGVVVHFEVFGFPNPYAVGDFAIADQGRTAVHEVGHYLGLRHIWGDGQGAIFGGVDCNATDGIDDTPRAGNNSQVDGCGANKNTCNDGAGDLPDMWENFMDYASEDCQTIFTAGQVAIMRSSVLNFRSGLLEAQCADTNNVSVQNIDNNWSVTIYPNPANNILNIDFGKPINNGVKAVLYNVVGTEVNQAEWNAGATTYPLNTANISNGIYFLKVFNANQQHVERIVVAK